MELELVRGCINDSLTIDGIDATDISEKELRNCIKGVIEKCNDIFVLRDILSDIIINSSDSICTDEPCEHCGDYTYIWNMSI